MLNRKLLLAGIFLLAFVLRLYRVQFPLADWHSWRQADTSAVSRNFVKNGFDLLHPRFDDLSNIPSGMENPEGWRFVEFPIYNAIHASVYKAWPLLSFEATGRLVSVFFSLLSLVFLYLIVTLFVDQRTALLAALFFAILPFNIYYNRVILPEPMTVAMGLGSLYFLSRFIHDKKSTVLYLVLGSVFFSVSLLLKPFVAAYLLPLAYLSVINFKNKKRDIALTCLSFLLAIIPFYWWRRYILQYPEGIPAYAWLLNANNIRFKGAFFWWIFAERIGKLILGGWGLILLGLGLIVRPVNKEGLFFYFFLAGNLFYLFFVATGNVQHDYYQILIVPVLTVFLAKGAVFLIKPPLDRVNHYLSSILLFGSVACMVFFSWFQVKDFFNINNERMVAAGKEADRILPTDAKVIAPYGGDTAFLYQTNRRGWPVGIDIEKFRLLGAEYYVNFNFGPETDWLEHTYCTVEKNNDFVIIDLTKKCP